MYRSNIDTWRHLLSPWGPRTLVLVGIILSLLVIGTVTVAVLWASYLSNQQAMEDRTMRLTRLLAEHTLRNIQSVDLLLNIIVNSSPLRLDDHDPEYEDWLRERLQNLPHVRALYLIGADGFITQDTDHPETPRVTLADRDYFQYHRDNGDSLHVARPLLSRSVNRFFVAASRRIVHSEGTFSGVAAAAIEPSFYEQFYADLVLDPGDALALWYEDGTLIARVPEDYGLVGEKLSDLSVFARHLREGPTGVLTGRSLYDPDQERIVGYHALPGLPLVVTASSSVQPAMAQWWQTVYAAAVGFVMLCMVSFAIPLLVFRGMRERDEMHRRTLLLQKSEALGRMAGGIAHDFRNVLASIDAGLRLMLRQNDSLDSNGYAARVQDAVDRGMRLSSQLLRFASGQKLEVVNADAGELITELEPMLRQAAGPGIRLDLALGSVPQCTVDRTQFDAAVLNLVINARDAMPDGGVVTVATDLWHQQRRRRSQLRPGTYVVVRVSDTGSGIPDDVIAHVFEPYFSTKGDKGTGLGLAQVLSLMRQIGGDARIATKAGSGATVELYFPCDQNENEGNS